jgi:plastocyanin
MKKIYMVSLLAGVALLVSACGSQGTNAPVSNISNPADVTPSTGNPFATSSNTATPNPSAITVSIKNFAFDPAMVSVKAGTTVTWINNDSVSHTVTSDSGNFLNSATLAPGESFSFTFATPGTESYHCAIHPMMKGTVTVEK